MLFVMHPFLRLAASFRKIFDFDGAEKDEGVTRRILKFAKYMSHDAEDTEKISFKVCTKKNHDLCSTLVSKCITCNLYIESGCIYFALFEIYNTK